LVTLVFHGSLMCREWPAVRDMCALLVGDTYKSCAGVLCFVHAVDVGRVPANALRREWATSVHPDRVSAVVQHGVQVGWYTPAEAERLVAFVSHTFARLRRRKPRPMLKGRSDGKGKGKGWGCHGEH
jgi:hypothetical protein